MTNVSDTLAERGARYGSFYDHATIAQGLQEVLLEAPNWFKLQPDVRQMAIVITDKLARILNGDPNYTDNYHDIQGYARLVEDRLIREEEAKKGALFEKATLTEEDNYDHEEIAKYRGDDKELRNNSGPVNGDYEAVGNYRG